MHKRIGAGLLAAMILLAFTGCSSAKKAKIEIDEAMSEKGLIEMLAETFNNETDYTVTLKDKSSKDIASKLDSNKFAGLIMLGDDTTAKTIQERGLTGGEFCYDTLVLVGPRSDKSGLAQLSNVSGPELLKHIALTKSNFVHAPADTALGKREAAMWASADLTPEGDWYLQASGDGKAVLDEALGKSAYALIDRQTFAENASNYDQLAVMQRGLSGMSERYFAIAPAIKEGKSENAAQAFANWLLSERAIELIGSYNRKADEPAFLPGSATATPPPSASPEASPGVSPSASPSAAPTTPTATQSSSSGPSAQPSPSASASQAQ